MMEIRQLPMTELLQEAQNFCRKFIKILGKKGMFKPRFIENTYRYHGLEPMGEIEWDEDFNPRF